MQKSTFQIKKMDCPAEEQLIRMKLERNSDIKQLVFDLSERKLEVFHSGDVAPIIKAIRELKLGDSYIATDKDEGFLYAASEKSQRKLFIYVFSINAFLFGLELISGFIAHSMGLIADSLDMLADAIIFGISLYVVGKSIRMKKAVAKISGWFQLTLALTGLIEVVRRFLRFTETPDYKTMMIVSSFALIGNTICLYLIQTTKSKHEAHIQAGKIFLSNDVVINVGVITAGGLVLLSSSNLPDLIIGAIVFVIVATGALRILKLSK